MKNKKGITQEEITYLILAIIIVVILLLFISRIDFTRTLDQQICHFSVLAKGVFSQGTFGKISQNTIPNACKTEKICITRDGSCEVLKKPIIEKVGSVEQIYSVLGENMVDCWWLFGEGKINYVETDMTNSKLYCSLCNEVYFDDSTYSLVNKDKPDLDRIKFYEYLEHKNYSKTQTYSQYLKLPTSKELQDIADTTFKINERDVGSLPKESYLPKIDLTKVHYILTGEYDNIDRSSWRLIGGGVGLIGAIALTAGSAVLSPVVLIIYASFTAIGVGIGEGGSRIVASLVKGESGHDYVSTTLVEANSDNLNSLRCQTITTLS